MAWGMLRNSEITSLFSIQISSPSPAFFFPPQLREKAQLVADLALISL